MMNIKEKTNLMKLLLSLLILFAGCSSYKEIESTTAIVMKCTVIRIIPHEQFFEIDVKQGKNMYKVLSKRSNDIGKSIIRVRETYSLCLSPLYYYHRPSYIIVNNDTVSIAPNAGIYNKSFYIDYCNETLEVEEQIEVFEADNLNGLYLDARR